MQHNYLMLSFTNNNVIRLGSLNESNNGLNAQFVQIIIVCPTKVVSLHQSGKEQEQFSKGQRFAKAVSLSCNIKK